jgi:HTH-type transcriptional regulator/antitoxin HigA
MATKHKLVFSPDYGVAPGETLLETLHASGMTQADLAGRTGRPVKTINEIIKGKTTITPETALQFERVLGIPASFWNNLEKDYREFCVELREQSRLKTFTWWLKHIPLNELIVRGHVAHTRDQHQLVGEALRFFGVSSPQTWQQLWMSPRAAFRSSPAFASSPGAVAAWLRIGELKAKEISCSPFDKATFKTEVDRLRSLTVEDGRTTKERLRDQCRRAGVAVVFVSELSGTHVSGATHWLTPSKALVQLSCRYKTDDQFWHTFFHECGHILLHGKREAFVDSPRDKETKRQEREANEFAANLLVPAHRLRAFLSRWRGTQREIVRFAEDIGIAPGIVVGQLQHLGEIGYERFNQLKRYDFDLTDG